MVDTKKIEELRALAFASIPATARKAQQSVGFTSKGKRRRTAEEREEGELSSDEENAQLSQASVAATVTPPLSAVPSTGRPLQVYLNATAKQKGRPPVAFDSCPVISVDTPAPTTVISGPLYPTTMLRPQVSSESNIQGALPTFPGRDEIGSQTATRTSAVGKVGDTTAVSQFSITAPAALPLVGIRKEADAFLASLNIPVAANSPRPPGLPVERSMSLVIKFSDDDSDSDGEHQRYGFVQGQPARSGVENMNWVGNGLPTSSGVITHNTNSSNAPTGGLKSEIDRVKRQIAAIERIKGKASAPPASSKSLKSTAMDVSRQSSLKLGLTSAPANSRANPVDLESLRQQIAAKESELQLRKRQGIKEPVIVGTGSDIDCLTAVFAPEQATTRAGSASGNTVLAFPVKSTGHKEPTPDKAGEVQVGSTEVAITSSAKVSMASSAMDVSAWKNSLMDEMRLSELTVDCSPGSQQPISTGTDWVALKTLNSNREISLNSQIIESISRSGSGAEILEGPKISRLIPHGESQRKQVTIVQSSHRSETTDSMNNPFVSRVSHTPTKRKHNEAQLSNVTTGSEGAKKQKRSESSTQLRLSSPSKEKRRPGVDASSKKQEHSTIVPSSTLVKENDSVVSRSYDSAEGGLHLSTKSREFSYFPQGSTAEVSTVTEPRQGLDVRDEGRSKMVVSNPSDQTNHKGAANAAAQDVGVICSTDMACQSIAPESSTGLNGGNAASQLQTSSNLCMLEAMPLSGQRVQPTTVEGLKFSQGDGNFQLQGSNGFKERQIHRDVATSAISSPSRAIVERQGSAVLLSEIERDFQGVLAGTNSTSSRYPVWASENQIQSSTLGGFQGISEQDCDFGHESLRQLQEEEDLIDKELEEAQQNRRRCEVRERLARRQYRDAHEALHSANLQCDLLYQKREMLAARIKAAEIQYYSNSASLGSHVQQNEGTLVPYGFQGYPGRAPLSLRTPFWSREDRQLLHLPPDYRIEQGKLGSKPGPATVIDLSKEMQRGPQSGNHPDTGSLLIAELNHASSEPGSNGRRPRSVSEDSHQGSGNLDVCNSDAIAGVGRTCSSGHLNELETNSVVPCIESAARHHVEEMETEGESVAPSRNNDTINHASVSSNSREMRPVSVLFEPVPAQDKSIQQPVTDCTVFKADLDSSVLNNSPVSPINMEGIESSKGDITNQSKLAVSSSTMMETVHSYGLQREYAHGFSSASFAMNSDRITTYNVQDRMDAVGNDRPHKTGSEAGSLPNQNILSSCVHSPELTANIDLHDQQTCNNNEYRSTHEKVLESVNDKDVVGYNPEISLAISVAHLEHISTQVHSSGTPSNVARAHAADRDLTNQSGTAVADLKSVDLESTSILCQQHDEVAEERVTSVTSQEDVAPKPLATSSSTFSAASEADMQIQQKNESSAEAIATAWQEMGIRAKFQSAESRSAGNKFVHKILEAERGEKGIIDRKMESLIPDKEDLMGKDSFGQRVMGDAVRVQIERSDDLRIDIREIDIAPLKNNPLRLSDANEFQLPSGVKGVMQEVQSDLVPEPELGTHPSLSGEDMEVTEKCLQVEEDIEHSAPMIPSSKLKVLFRCALGLNTQKNMLHTEERKDPYSLVCQRLTIGPCRYESPLCAFRSYRLCPQFSDVFHLSIYSNTWTHDIDPYKPICQFEHRGKCNNDECHWQHKKDYTLSPNQVLDQLHSYAEVNPFRSRMDHTVRSEMMSTCTTSSESMDDDILNTVRQRSSGQIVVNPVGSPNSSHSKWNSYITKPPVYGIGSYLVQADCFGTLSPVTTCKQQVWRLGFCQSFSMPLPLLRQLPIDMPCLLDSSIEGASLGSGIASSTRLLAGNRSQLEVEGCFFKGLEDVESWLEVALDFIDFDLNTEKSEGCKMALYVLSRALEAKPHSVALWVVYLHLFYRREKSIGKDDMFHHAVQYNKGSYELWMMFINSRKHLAERLEAYESAIIALGSMAENQGHHLMEESSFILDLVLQMLNCMCVSDLNQQAVAWIDDLAFFASEDVQDLERHEINSASILLACLTKRDTCILWVCCAYVIAEAQLPVYIIERLGCKQELPLCGIWQDRRITKSRGAHAMRLMHIAASGGKGCLALDSVDFSVDKDTRLSMEAMAVNFVQCAAVCEGLDSSLPLADKFMNVYPTSIALILIRVHLEERHKDKKAGLNIFEKALSHWPLHQPGIMRLWNQYIGYAFEVEGMDYVKLLLVRCAAQVEEEDPHRCSSNSENFGTFYPPSFTREPTNNLNDHKLHVQGSDGGVRHAFQLLPSILKHQPSRVSGPVQRVFSNQDVVFGFLNLAFFEALSGDVVATNNAVECGLKTALDADDVQHCLKEIAALSFFGPANPTHLNANLLEHKVLGVLDRCFLESQLLTTMHPLPRRLCESIKKRRVRLFVDSILGPSPTENSLINSILETFFGPTLLPEANVPMKELTDFVENVMEVSPANVRLAASACRAVQSRINSWNSVARPAVLFWSSSLLINSLCQSSPPAAEHFWLEAGHLLELLGVDSLVEDFYQQALAVYPFSTALWRGLLAVSNRTGHSELAMESILQKGIRLDL